MSIRHNCDHGGCYIKTQSPDWGFLDNAFSGRIKVGDIDGIVEANGHVLIIEWKGAGVPIPRGQEIMFEQITKKNLITVYVVNGDPAESVSSHLKVYSNGSITFNGPCDNDLLKKYCTYWEQKARSS